MKFEISKTNNIKGEKFMWKNIVEKKQKKAKEKKASREGTKMSIRERLSKRLKHFSQLYLHRSFYLQYG